MLLRACLRVLPLEAFTRVREMGLVSQMQWHRLHRNVNHPRRRRGMSAIVLRVTLIVIHSSSKSLSSYYEINTGSGPAVSINLYQPPLTIQPDNRTEEVVNTSAIFSENRGYRLPGSCVWKCHLVIDLII